MISETCNKPQCKFTRTKVNLQLANIIKNTILSGEGRLKDPIENNELNILKIFDCIKSQECVRVRNYKPDENNEHLEAISLGPSYLEQQINKAIDKATENRLIPPQYAKYLRQQIGLEKPTQKITEDKEINDLPNAHVTINLPQVRQSKHFSCGSAVIQMVAAYYGYNIREEDLIKKLHIGNNSGVKLSQIQKVAKEIGLQSDKDSLSYEEISNTNKPLVVAIFKEEENYHHFVLVIGRYDGGLILRDPSKFSYGYIPKEDFVKRCFGSDGKFLTLSLYSNKEPDY